MERGQCANQGKPPESRGQTSANQGPRGCGAHFAVVGLKRESGGAVLLAASWSAVLEGSHGTVAEQQHLVGNVAGSTEALDKLQCTGVVFNLPGRENRNEE